ncbi:MAG: hypothetical protein QG632_220 [Candidatus Dependentiae bacterium]|nr:hypothetical protein [Candidatus Dependentiae bacterium]
MKIQKRMAVLAALGLAVGVCSAGKDDGDRELDRIMMYRMLNSPNQQTVTTVDRKSQMEQIMTEQRALQRIVSELHGKTITSVAELEQSFKGRPTVKKLISGTEGKAGAKWEETPGTTDAFTELGLLTEYKFHAGTGGFKQDELEKWLMDRYEANASLLKEYRSETADGHGPIGQAAVKGFLGRNAAYFTDIKVNSLAQGVAAGMVYRTMFVVGDEFEKAIRNEGGQVCDAVFGGSLRTLRGMFFRLKHWLFNGGAYPYSLEQVSFWREEVVEVILKGLDKAATKAQGGVADGFGTRARGQNKFDVFAGVPTEEGEVEDANVVDATWVEMVGGFARDLDRLTMRIEFPKLYYSPGDDHDEQVMMIDGRADILDMATRIQEMLQLIKQHILLPSRTLKDLAVGDLKVILPRLIDEVNARFKLFEGMVKNYHGIYVKANSSGGDSSVSKPAVVRSGGSLYPGLDS